MTKQKESFADKVFRFSIPHVLVLILMIILICCGLTYIVPAGLYEIDAQTGMVVPNSFHWVESSPISPWRALVEVTNGVASQGVIFALLFIMGGIFVVETLSVMIQTTYFRYSGGKRIFLMAPIHHHFELKGWKETQVVTRFWIITFVLVLIGLSTLKIR